MSRLILSLLALLTLSLSSSFADVLTLDLARQAPGAAVTLPAGAFPEISVRVINRAPKLAYSTSVEDSIIAVPELTDTTFPSPGALAAAPDDCDRLLKMARDLSQAANEATVGDTVADIQKDLGKCAVQASLDDIKRYVARTVVDLQGVYRVQAGHQLTITVTRDDADKKKLTWVLIVKGEARGLWLTTYGAMVTQNKDERFFTEAAGDDKFAIRPETAATGGKVVPCVLFTWLPRARQASSWAFGPTGGFGVKDDRPAILVGYGATYNWNLGIVAGISMIQETRLNGKYKSTDPPQLIGENLNDSQLMIKSYQLRPFVAVAFRFGSNPFGSAGTPGTDSGATTRKKDAGSKAPGN
jgi:hypothetical protein